MNFAKEKRRTPSTFLYMAYIYWRCYLTEALISLSQKENFVNSYRLRLIGRRTPLHFRLTIVYHNSRKTSTKKIKKKIEHRRNVAPSKIEIFI